MDDCSAPTEMEWRDKNADIKQIYGCTSYFYMCGYI